MRERPYFIVNIEAVIQDGDKYLLIRRSMNEEHSAGTLSLPGGKLDREPISPEALEQALRREIAEEVGLILGQMAYLESKTFLMDTGEWCLSICFLSKEFTGQATAKSEDEVDEVLWLMPSELVQQENCPLWTKQSIQAAVEYGSKSSTK